MKSLYLTGKIEWRQDKTKDLAIRVVWCVKTWEDFVIHSNGKFERVPGHYSFYRVFSDSTYKAKIDYDCLGKSTCHDLSEFAIEILKKRLT